MIEKDNLIKHCVNQKNPACNRRIQEVAEWQHQNIWANEETKQTETTPPPAIKWKRLTHKTSQSRHKTLQANFHKKYYRYH